MRRWIAREDDQDCAHPYLQQQNPTCPTGYKSAIGKKGEDEDEERQVDLIEERRDMLCHFWPQPRTETILIGTGGGTEHLEVPGIPSHAIDQRCQLEEGYSSPQDSGEEEPSSTQACIRLVRLSMAYRGGCLCLIQVHLDAPFLALLKPEV